MHDRPGLRPRRLDRSRRASAGFSFLELIVVMGILAVLMGLTVGVLTSAGSESQLTQARAILQETAFRVQGESIGGGRKAVLEIQTRETSDNNEVMQVGAYIAQTVLTHQFETLEDASRNIVAKTNGGVRRALGEGYHGSAARFERGSFLEVPARTRFAMTEGLQIDVRVKPDPGANKMNILRADDDVYVLSLVRKKSKQAYGLKLSLKLFAKGKNHRNAQPELQHFESKGSPVQAGADWQHLQVSFDGQAPSLRVNGIEYYNPDDKSRRRGASLDENQTDALRTIAIPKSGALKLFISDGGSSFIGLMDNLQLRGVFRSDELQRDLPGALELIDGSLPVRVVYINGVLDPDVHRKDVILRFRDTNRRAEVPIELRLGTNGTIESGLGTQVVDGQSTRSP